MAAIMPQNGAVPRAEQTLRPLPSCEDETHLVLDLATGLASVQSRSEQFIVGSLDVAHVRQYGKTHRVLVVRRTRRNAAPADK
jgi:hypothetical protein